MANYNLRALIQGLKPYFLRKDGNNTVSGDIYPSVGGTYDLGSSAKPFANIYTNSIIATVGTPDEKVKINASDPTEGFLEDKIAAGTYITLGNSGTLLTVNVNPSALLLRSGTNSLQGNLAVDPGYTIDGVDISAFKALYDVHIGLANAHHEPVVAFSPLRQSGQDIYMTIYNDSGLVDNGGDLYVNAQDGLKLNTLGLHLDLYDTTLAFTSGQVRVNRAHNFVWSGTHEFDNTTRFDGAATFNSTTTFNTNPQVYGNINFKSASRTITTDAGLDLSLLPGNDLHLSPGNRLNLYPGGDAAYMGNSVWFRTDYHIDTTIGIRGFSLDEILPNYRHLVIGSIKADELKVRVFTADEVRVNRGQEVWSRSFGIVQEDFIIPALNNSVDVWFEDSAAFGSARLFAANNYIQFRVIDWATGLDVSNVWFQVSGDWITPSEPVTDGVDASGNPVSTGVSRQEWTLIRRQGGTTGNTIKAGQVGVDRGQSGQSFIELLALNQYQSEYGPYFQMGDWTGANPYAGDINLRVRMGNLRGTVGFGSDTWGFAAGNNLGYAPENPTATQFTGFVASDSGVDLYSTDIQMWDNGTLGLEFDATTGINLSSDVNGTYGLNGLPRLSWYRSLNPTANLVAQITGYWQDTNPDTNGLYMYAQNIADSDAVLMRLDAYHGGPVNGLAYLSMYVDPNAVSGDEFIELQTGAGGGLYIVDNEVTIVGSLTNTTINGTLQSGNITVTDGTSNAYLQAGISGAESRLVLDNNTGSGDRWDIGVRSSDGALSFQDNDTSRTAMLLYTDGSAYIRNGLRVGDSTHTADGENDALFFGDGTNAQPGAYHSKVKIFGGNSQTRHLELYQVDSGDAYVLADYSTLHLQGGANGQAIAFDINGTEYARLNTTGLGIGGTAADMLHVHKSQAAATRMRISNDNAAGYTTLLFEESGNFRGWVQYSNADNAMYYRSNETGTFVFEAPDATSCGLQLRADRGDDYSDIWRINAADGGIFSISKLDTVTGATWIDAFSATIAQTNIKNAVFMDDVADDTSANAANVYIDSGTGRLYRSMSSIRYKRDVRDLPEPLAAKAIMALRPVTYRSKAEADDANELFVGLIAEEVHSAFGTHRNPYVDYNADGQPENVRYAALTAPLIATVQSQQRKIEELYQRIEKLENM